MSLALTLYNAATPWLPNKGFFSARRFWLRLASIGLADGVRIASAARFYGMNIAVGRDTWIGPETCIFGTTTASVKVGQCVDIGPGVLITSGTHSIGSPSRRAGPPASSDVMIGDGTWVGARAVILPGAKIGKGSIVAAGAVVTAGSYPDNVLLVGVPARVAKPL